MNELIKYWTFIGLAGFAFLKNDIPKTPGHFRDHVSFGVMDTVYTLDPHKREISQLISPVSLSGHNYGYVEIELIKVINPKQYPLIFYVYHQAAGNKKVLLGSFGPFPANNTGKFIVSSHGKPIKEGAIVLSLTIPAKLLAGDTVLVKVNKMKLREK